MRIITDISERETWQRHLYCLSAALSDRGLLAIFTAGRLAAPLAEFRAADPEREPSWLGSDLRRALVKLRFRLEAAYRIGGGLSIAWAVLTRLARAAHREALADRTETAYRQSLVSRGPGKMSLSSLLLVRRSA